MHSTQSMACCIARKIDLHGREITKPRVSKFLGAVKPGKSSSWIFMWFPE